jgi:CO/xanthine dehydrogenase FAD-binding subunit
LRTLLDYRLYANNKQDLLVAYYQPTELGSALTILRSSAPQIVAGGTDVYPAMKPGCQPACYLDVTRIQGFSDILVTDTDTRFGAAVTWSDVLRADLPHAFDALKLAAREVGSPQIQNAGTIAGNICNASPAADGVPPLLALNAKVALMSAARGICVLPIAKFINGVRQTVLADDALVTAIIIPKTPRSMVSGFEKLESRRYFVISIVMTAANILLDETGRIAEARIAVGSCSAVAQRLPALEVDLVGKDPSRITITADHLEPLKPIDDVRGTGTYRLETAAQQIERAIRGG